MELPIVPLDPRTDEPRKGHWEGRHWVWDKPFEEKPRPRSNYPADSSPMRSWFKSLKESEEMGFCISEDMRVYIVKHLRDDAANHRSMTTQEYHDSHGLMWQYIDWNTWKDVMNAQAEYSEKSANMITMIPGCGKESFEIARPPERLIRRKR